MRLTEATAALADILARENTVLAALAFAECAKLAADKERAIAAFVAARDIDGSDAVPLVLGHRLRELAAENKRLLEQAVHVQGRVIACIARAAPRRNGAARGYGATGAWTGEQRAMPIALAAQA